MEQLSDIIYQNPVSFVLLLTVIVSFAIQSFYYFYYYGTLAKHKNKTITSQLPPVSVIICARNEAKNLSKNLPLVLEQDYPNFEVIVVNDASEDDTEHILAKFKQENKHLYYTNIPYDKKFFHGKKLAVTLGVKAAKNNRLIFTDADCYPVSKNWLKHMVSATNNENIVLGYGPYKKSTGWINRLQRYDAFFIAVQYLSFALKKKPYMGVGRNMSYTKNVFNKVGGFKNHSHILSGDDDLFVQKAATKDNVSICIEPEAHTFSESSKTFAEWRHQKTRHLSTASHYKFSAKRILGIEAFSRQLFWWSAIISLFFSIFAHLIIAIIFLKLILQLTYLRRIAKRFHQKNIIWIGIILDFLLPILIGFLFLRGKLNTKRNQWT